MRVITKVELITVIETNFFYKECRKILSESELEEFKDYIAAQPEVGDVIPGLRGIRKVRWQANQRGKSGGARVVYFFYNKDIPLFLLDIYTKSKQPDLTADDKTILNRMVQEILKNYGK